MKKFILVMLVLLSFVAWSDTYKVSRKSDGTFRTKVKSSNEQIYIFELEGKRFTYNLTKGKVKVHHYGTYVGDWSYDIGSIYAYEETVKYRTFDGWRDNEQYKVVKDYVVRAYQKTSDEEIAQGMSAIAYAKSGTWIDEAPQLNTFISFGGTSLQASHWEHAYFIFQSGLDDYQLMVAKDTFKCYFRIPSINYVIEITAQEAIQKMCTYSYEVNAIEALSIHEYVYRHLIEN